MREFEANNPGVQVTGGVIHAFLDAFGQYRGRGEKVVARHCGVSHVDTSADTQYSMQGFLDAMRELSEQFGAAFMRKVGESIYDRAVFPPDIKTLSQMLSSIDVAYHMNHVDHEEAIGHYDWEPRGESGGTMTCDNPYPCSFDLGILNSSSRRFEPGVTVNHADGPCRARGDEHCCYTVEW